MTRTLAFAAVLAPRPAFPLDSPTPAVELDPRSATALQVALVLADQRQALAGWGDFGGTPDDDSDAAILAHVRNTVDLLEVYGDDALAHAYRAVLTAP